MEPLTNPRASYFTRFLRRFGIKKVPESEHKPVLVVNQTNSEPKLAIKKP